MENKRLTKKQLSLQNEIGEIVTLLQLDYQNIQRVSPSTRTSHLEIIKNHIIRGQIIMYYTLTDELLSERIYKYYFGATSDSIKLWKTKHFQLFNYHVLEELSLMQKLRFVRAIRSVPRTIVQDVERLNALRNGIAHAFFPENLKKFKPQWKGHNIFGLKGLKFLVEDMDKIFDHFQ
jgi:hypothetical protein